MDKVYFWILMLFLIVLALDFSERFFKRKSEVKEGFGSRWSTGDYPNYYEENRLIEYSPPITSNSVNINFNSSNSPTHAQFSNFTTNGITPPFLKCPSCKLQYQCANYPYEVSDKNESVCSNCVSRVFMDQNNFPVYARSNGRPRQCRDLLSSQKPTVPLWGTDAKFLTKLQSV